MTIIGLCGSPKPGASGSLKFLDTLQSLFSENIDYQSIVINDEPINQSQIDQCVQANALLISVPLYFDGIPAHLLSSLERLEFAFKRLKVRPVLYVIINSGYIEPKQSTHALNMFRLFAKRANLTWGSAMAVGAGNMLIQMTQIPLGTGIRKNLGHALNQFKNDIEGLVSSDDYYVKPNFPRWLYMLLGNRGWIKQAKANQLNKKSMIQKH